MSVGKRLKSLRLGRGETLRGLGEILGVRHGSIAKWENNTNSIKRCHLDSLSSHYEVSPKWLLFGEDEMDSSKSLFGDEGLQRRLDALEKEDRVFLMTFLEQYVSARSKKSEDFEVE
jgi:transcriptional regulator with XRE-family HTH domain